MWKKPLFTEKSLIFTEKFNSENEKEKLLLL